MNGSKCWMIGSSYWMTERKCGVRMKKNCEISMIKYDFEAKHALI